MKKWICFLLSAFTAVTVLTAPVLANSVPYRAYTFNFWGNDVPSPAAYVPAGTIGGPDVDETLGAFKAPEDMFVDANGDIYLADSGNNRLVIFDRRLNLKKVIDSFQRDGQTDTFNLPSGICVADNLDIYIADTNNNRIVVLDKDGNFIKLVTEPQLDTLTDSFVFAPLKVCVDPAGRVYAIVKNVFEGIMSFDSDGTFFGYFGTVRVAYNPVEWIWRMFSTAEQRSRTVLFIPVEFASMDIDSDGFIYTTNIETGQNNKVKRLNPSGEDVLINFNPQPITGDLSIRTVGQFSGPTQFADVVSRESGMYSALDSTRGRLYTYDSEGNLLYVLGGSGNTLGMGRLPVAVEVSGDYILTLDRQRGEIVYFEPTEYGRLINEAVAMRYDGDEASAVENWRKVLALNENYTLAYTGIGKALLAAGENREAMTYLKKGMNIQYYSVAFQRYRNEILKENMSIVLTVLMAALAVVVGVLVYKNAQRKKIRLQEEIRENEARAARLRQREAGNGA
jgi:DNA-binding beta-propeller fold protein YncE/phage head maturation protease